MQSSRLKSLELQGFKTFASRTHFEFAPAVTAIVGPNGSGKSNLSDALRWVLGEQSYSLLRAKKTEDLIFSGGGTGEDGAGRPRAGMASATITFDNSDSWLPIDYTEVAITRRAYRDGDNEYLLNGQRVRLKDVTELLAQSGLSERTYTIIGQGLVETALSLRAEERRRLFEEAAGIGLHRSRREEALRRLEATARNLERVEDILAELTPRLRSLERQAGRAREYEQVRADLRVVLREWYGYHWRRTQLDLAEARELVRAREAVLDRDRQEQQKLAESLAASSGAIHALRSRLGDLHHQASQQSTRREGLIRQLAVSEERLRSLGETCQSLADELIRLEEEKTLSQERLAAAAGELAQLQAEGAEARTQVVAARSTLQMQQAERSRVEQSARSARQELSALTAQQSHLQARQVEAQASQARRKEQLERAAAALFEEERSLSAAQSAHTETTRLDQEAQQAAGEVEARLRGARGRLGEVEGQREDAVSQRAALEAQAARLRAQRDVLLGAEQNLAGVSEGARLLVQAARSDRLPGVRGLLSSFLDLPAEYETAIAAALGEWIDSVILDSTPHEALEFFSGEKKTLQHAIRVALLPLPQIHPVDAHLQAPAVEGMIGPAISMIKAPADLREALEILLGSVWVVRDRSAAFRALEAFHLANINNRDLPEASRARLVTLEGEVFFVSGPILAGSGQGESSPEGTSTPLSRQRQLRELIGQLEANDRRLVEQNDQVLALEQARARLKEEEGLLGHELQTARTLEDSRRSTRREAELALDKARRQVQWRREEILRLEKEIRQGEADLASVAARLKELEPGIAQARESLRSLSEELSQTLSLEESTTQLSHWETRLAVAERAAADAQKRYTERQAAQKREAERQVSQSDRLEEVQASRALLEEQFARLRKEEGLLGEEMNALRLQIEPAEAELQALESEQSETSVQEASARQAVSLAEHHHAQARILLARRQEALDALRHRIEDDFGLVAFPTASASEQGAQLPRIGSEYASDQAGQAPLPLDGMVEQLPVVHELSADIEETLKRQRAQLRRMGPINPEAEAEYQGVRERFDFLTTQVTDLNHAQADLRKVIAELDHLMEREFRKTFEAVAREFHEIFTRLFGGGTAKLLLTSGEPSSAGESGSAHAGTGVRDGRPSQGIIDAGIEIEARLPGRRTQGLALLSGGERSLTATALVFALLKVSPTPFCVLDEVDAMLDEANVGRFRELLAELSQNTQFIVVTHNRNTVQAADVIYGVTMGRDSASQVLSLKMDEFDQRMGRGLEAD